MEDNTIQCPHCYADECMVERVDNDIQFLCIGCGYGSHTKYIEGSEILKLLEQTSAELILELKFVDQATKLVWYPTVINFPNKGMLYPVGTTTSWEWCALKAIPIPEADRKKFPNPNQPGTYYEYKMDSQHPTFYPLTDFKLAARHIGAVI